jgi:cation diffusion facilitator CzcD-associated flavoprotein CzcO
VFLSARWQPAVALAGTRVAVVGSGASAVQLVPHLAEQVGRLHLFQRTAQWVLPKPDHYVPPAERWVLRTFPAAARALRTAEYAGLEAFGLGFRHPWILQRVQRVGARHLRSAIHDAELRAKLTPTYTLGCKRLLMSNTFYPALARPNVDVHATEVQRIDGSRVIGADGTAAEVDTIVFATGFHILDMPVAGWVYGAHGKSLAEHWQGSPRAYLGTAVSGFPNFFLLLGPSLGTGHSSAFSILEAQLAYIMNGLRAMRGVVTIDVRADVQAAYCAEVQDALRTTVYETGGCQSYYRDDNGVNTFSWPWSTGALRRRIRDFDLDAYAVTS